MLSNKKSLVILAAVIALAGCNNPSNQVAKNADHAPEWIRLAAMPTEHSNEFLQRQIDTVTAMKVAMPVVVTNLPGADGKPGAGGGTPVYVTNPEALATGKQKNQDGGMILDHKPTGYGSDQVFLREIRTSSGLLCVVTTGYKGANSTTCDFGHLHDQKTGNQKMMEEANIQQSPVKAGK